MGATGLAALSRLSAMTTVAGLLMEGIPALVVPVTLLLMDLGRPGTVVLGTAPGRPPGTLAAVIGMVVLGTAPGRPPGTLAAVIGTVVLGTAPRIRPRGMRRGTAVLGTAPGSRPRGPRRETAVLGTAPGNPAGVLAATLDAMMLVIAPAIAAGAVSVVVGTTAETIARLRMLRRSLPKSLFSVVVKRTTATPRHPSMR